MLLYIGVLSRRSRVVWDLYVELLIVFRRLGSNRPNNLSSYRSNTSLRVKTVSSVTSLYRYMPLAKGCPASSRPFQCSRW